MITAVSRAVDELLSEEEGMRDILNKHSIQDVVGWLGSPHMSSELSMPVNEGSKDDGGNQRGGGSAGELSPSPPEKGFRVRTIEDRSNAM